MAATSASSPGSRKKTVRSLATAATNSGGKDVRAMQRNVMTILCAVGLSGLTAFAPASIHAQAGTAAAPAGTPDFSGVYYPFQQGRGGAGAPAAAPAAGQRATPPPPTRSA